MHMPLISLFRALSDPREFPDMTMNLNLVLVQHYSVLPIYNGFLPLKNRKVGMASTAVNRSQSRLKLDHIKVRLITF